MGREGGEEVNPLNQVGQGCRHEGRRGLGLYSMRDRNHALLCKWAWRFALGTNSLWRKVLVTRYGVEDLRGWQLENRAAREGSIVIKSIVKLGKGEGKVGGAFKGGLRVLANRGDNVLFWKDKWVGESSLSEAFLGCLDLHQTRTH